MKKFPVSNELSNVAFYTDDAGSGGVHYDGGQKNGRDGSSLMTPTSGDTNVPDFGGINFDNTQIDFGSVKMSMDDNMQWEKKQGVLINPTGKYKDINNNFETKEIDLSKHINVIGMPNPNVNHNSSTDCYYE